MTIFAYDQRRCLQVCMTSGSGSVASQTAETQREQRTSMTQRRRPAKRS